MALTNRSRVRSAASCRCGPRRATASYALAVGLAGVERADRAALRPPSQAGRRPARRRHDARRRAPVLAGRAVGRLTAPGGPSPAPPTAGAAAGRRACAPRRVLRSAPTPTAGHDVPSDPPPGLHAPRSRCRFGRDVGPRRTGPSSRPLQRLRRQRHGELHRGLQQRLRQARRGAGRDPRGACSSAGCSCSRSARGVLRVPDPAHVGAYVFVLSLPGVAFAAYLAIASWLVLHVVCLLCVTIDVATLGVCVIGALMTRFPFASLPGRARPRSQGRCWPVPPPSRSAPASSPPPSRSWRCSRTRPPSRVFASGGETPEFVAPPPAEEAAAAGVAARRLHEHRRRAA